MQEAIQRAIEGGWDKSRTQISPRFAAVDTAETLLDPEFWKCLGKAEGWRETNYGFTFYNEAKNKYYSDKGAGEWEVNMHYFINHLAEDKDINSFFDNLLK